MSNQPMNSADYGLKVKWRNPQQSVSWKRLARHLKLGDCLDDDEKEDLAYYLSIATEMAEDSLRRAVTLQVRELTFEHFPSCGEPLQLDCVGAWDLDDWKNFTSSIFTVDVNGDPIQVEGENQLRPDLCEAEKWKETVWDQVNACFTGDAPAEIDIKASGCSCDGSAMAITTDFTVSNARQPNRLCLVKSDGCCEWPSTCCDCICDNVKVRYICGDMTNCSLMLTEPRLHHLIIMNAALLYENPEMGGLGNRTGDVQKFMDRFSNSLKWRY